jgi:hypothetical protein
VIAVSTLVQFYGLIGGCLLSIVVATVVQIWWTRRQVLERKRRRFPVDDRKGSDS